jgi:hypothetical protein
MAKEFILAIVRANGTRWLVQLSNRRDTEPFVGKDGALGWLESSVACEKPVQAVVYRPGTDAIEEAYFFESGRKRKLNLLTLAGENTKRGNW